MLMTYMIMHELRMCMTLCAWHCVHDIVCSAECYCACAYYTPDTYINVVKSYVFAWCTMKNCVLDRYVDQYLFIYWAFLCVLCVQVHMCVCLSFMLMYDVEKTMASWWRLKLHTHSTCRCVHTCYGELHCITTFFHTCTHIP